MYATDVRALLASALAWFRPACHFEQAYKDYQRGNFAYALRQSHRLARQGNAHAARLIGDMHRNGEGVRQDLAVAMKWYKKAADAGDELARRILNLESGESESSEQRKRSGVADGAMLWRASRTSSRLDTAMLAPIAVVPRGDSPRRKFGRLGEESAVVSGGVVAAHRSSVANGGRGAPLQEGRLGESRDLRAFAGGRVVSASSEPPTIAKVVGNAGAHVSPDADLRKRRPGPIFELRGQPTKSDRSSDGGMLAGEGLKRWQAHGIQSPDHGRADVLSVRESDERRDVGASDSGALIRTSGPNAEADSPRAPADASRGEPEHASVPDVAEGSELAFVRDRNGLETASPELLVAAVSSDPDVEPSGTMLSAGEETAPEEPTDGAQDHAVRRNREEELLPSLDAEALKTRAERGDADAMLELAAMFRIGLAAKVDMAAAAEWYRRAATDGNAEGQFQLGRMYHKGQGVRRNRAHSISWTRRAALGGHPRAPYELGFVLAENPRSVSELISSYAWLSVAYESGLSSAVDLRNTVAAELSKTHLEEAVRVVERIRAEMTGA